MNRDVGRTQAGLARLAVGIGFPEAVAGQARVARFRFVEGTLGSVHQGEPLEGVDERVALEHRVRQELELAPCRLDRDFEELRERAQVLLRQQQPLSDGRKQALRAFVEREAPGRLLPRQDEGSQAERQRGEHACRKNVGAAHGRPPQREGRPQAASPPPARIRAGPRPAPARARHTRIILRRGCLVPGLPQDRLRNPALSCRRGGACPPAPGRGELADRLARSPDVSEQKRLKEELARMTFGE